jgi:hypothetical protein
MGMSNRAMLNLEAYLLHYGKEDRDDAEFERFILQFPDYLGPWLPRTKRLPPHKMAIVNRVFGMATEG